MTDHGKAQIQALGAGLVGFVVVVGAGAALMLHHGGSPVKAPVTTYAPVDAAASLPAPAARPAAGAPLGESAAAASSPAPLLPESERVPAGTAAAPAAAAPAPAAEAPSFSRKLVVTQHLDGTSSASSSARASVASAPKAKADARPAKKPFAAPKLDLSKTQSALASSIHYGVSSRAELMGRAAGPVYNFSGKKQAPAQQGLSQSGAGAMQQMDEVQQRIDDSPLADSDKAAIKANLGQARQAVDSTSGAAK